MLYVRALMLCYHPMKEVLMLVALLCVLVFLVAWMILSYNSLVRLRNKCEESEASLNAHLQERYDLVPDLVETVKGYARHERETLEAVMAARNRMGGADAEDGLSEALGKLFALSESYPDLKADKNFISLQESLGKLEKDILGARTYYNAIVRTYNDKTMVFPTSLIASLFHFGRKEYLKVDEKALGKREVRF